MKNLSIVLLLFIMAGCSNRESAKRGLEETKLPSFSLLLMDSVTKISSTRLADGKPVVIFYFSPDCPYCRAQTEAIISEIKALDDIQFCLLTPAPFPDIKRFYNEYQLRKFENIVVGQDYTAFAVQHFKITTVPYIIIYDNNKKLKEIVTGRIDPSVIRSILHG